MVGTRKETRELRKRKKAPAADRQSSEAGRGRRGGDWGGQRPLLPVQLHQEALVVVEELGALESVPLDSNPKAT